MSLETEYWELRREGFGPSKAATALGIGAYAQRGLEDSYKAAHAVFKIRHEPRPREASRGSVGAPRPSDGLVERINPDSDAAYVNRCIQLGGFPVLPFKVRT